MSTDSETVKRTVMKQVLEEANLANARTLIEVCSQSPFASYLAP